MVSIRGSARALSVLSHIEQTLPRKQRRSLGPSLCGVSDGSDFTLREGLYPSEPSAQRGLGLEERTQDEWTDEGGCAIQGKNSGLWGGSGRYNG